MDGDYYDGDWDGDYDDYYDGPDGYDGDYMIEVDEPSVESRFESHRIAYEWAQRTLPIRR